MPASGHAALVRMHARMFCCPDPVRVARHWRTAAKPPSPADAPPSTRVRPRWQGMPEQRLMLAVLHDALRTLTSGTQGAGYRPHRRFSEARTWILSDDVSWPFSFRNLCLALDPCPDDVRCRLRPWLDRGCEAATARGRRRRIMRNSRFAADEPIAAREGPEPMLSASARPRSFPALMARGIAVL